jgi:hypothetical protein
LAIVSLIEPALISWSEVVWKKGDMDKSGMDKNRKLELIQRSLGIRHKLKVHESMKSPDTHEELSLMLLSKWELEDELKAIEDLLNESRNTNVSRKKDALAKNGPIKEADPKRRVLEVLTADQSSNPN